MSLLVLLGVLDVAVLALVARVRALNAAFLTLFGGAPVVSSGGGERRVVAPSGRGDTFTPTLAFMSPSPYDLRSYGL
jgi:hypothetical protein